MGGVLNWNFWVWTTPGWKKWRWYISEPKYPRSPIHHTMVIAISKDEKVMPGLVLSELGKTLTIKEVRQRMDRSQWGGMNGNTQPRVSCRWLSILSHSLWTWWAINPWMSERTESTQWLPLCQKRLWVVEMSSFVFLGSSEYNCRTEDKEGD